jgi:serine/threonine protein kinase/tetratricopeptide (TPR) repeat protein
VEPRSVAHFDVLGRLGSGGMGVVYRARDRVLGRDVALKLVLPEHAGDSGARQRFLREARAAAVLMHPGIAAVYEAGEAAADEPGGPAPLYIAEELVEGETLAERLRRGPLEIEDVLGLGAQMADALGEAHARGIVHRDVKPSNLMVTPDGRLKVLDFGLARRHLRGGEPGASEAETLSRTAPGLIVGTPAYMAPEQIAGEAVDARADVYSAGCVLYELLSGRPPFTGASTAEVLRRSLTESPRPIEQLREGVPPALAVVVARSLARDPRERPADGRALAAALRDTFSPADAAASGRPPSAGRHRRVVRTATALLAGLGLAGLAWLLLERSTGPALAFKERDFVLVTDVVNETGEPVFDLALKSALETDLRQSPYVNVVDPAQVQGTLRLMRLEPEARLDTEVGRALCRRTGTRALVVPRILRAGEAYQVGASLVEPATGRVAAEAHVLARGREEVLLSAIDELTRQLRRRLGESLASISRSDPPLARYTTSSLEALELAALGARAGARTDHAKAERYYRQALQHDPKFAAARGALGLVLLQFLGRPEEGKRELAQALADADEVSPREYLHLRAVNRQYVTEEFPAALDDYRFMSELYPDMFQPYNNSGRILEKLGRHAEAAAMYERAHEADPRNPIPLWNTYFLNAGPLKDPRKAEAAARALVALDPDVAHTRHALAWSLVMQRRFAEAEEELRETLRIDPSHRWAGPNLAHLQLRRGAVEEAIAGYRSLGHLDRGDSRGHDALCLGLALQAGGRRAEAGSVTHAAAEAMAARGRKRLDSGDEGLIAALLAVAGRPGEARAHLARAERAPDPAGRDLIWLARAYAALGEDDRAAALVERALGAGSEDPYLILIDPSFAAIRDRPEIDRLIPAGAGSPPPGAGGSWDARGRRSTAPPEAP